MIKFRERFERAWDIQNERMIEDPFYFSYPYDKEDEGKWLCYEGWSDYDDGISRLCYRMEYSGINDSDKKDIFEKDYVEAITYLKKGSKVFGNVCFDEGCFCIDIIEIKGDCGYDIGQKIPLFEFAKIKIKSV